MYPRSMADSDCVMVMGSNMAENHPVAFRWPMKAKVNGATLIHVDPRFTRTSAMATSTRRCARAATSRSWAGSSTTSSTIRAEPRPVLQDLPPPLHERATLVADDYKDAEEADGVFSGLMEYKGGAPAWPTTASSGSTTRNPGSTSGRAAAAPRASRRRNTARSGEVPGHTGDGAKASTRATPDGPPFDPLVTSLVKPPAEQRRDAAEPALRVPARQAPLRRYTPEMVERVTGCPKETFLKVARALLDHSAPDRPLDRLRGGVDPAHQRAAE
jgi:formate dehydrogenase major subunit